MGLRLNLRDVSGLQMAGDAGGEGRGRGLRTGESEGGSSAWSWRGEQNTTAVPTAAAAMAGATARCPGQQSSLLIAAGHVPAAAAV